jgi:hypothetical protein
MHQALISGLRPSVCLSTAGVPKPPVRVLRAPRHRGSRSPPVEARRLEAPVLVSRQAASAPLSTKGVLMLDGNTSVNGLRMAVTSMRCHRPFLRLAREIR